MARELRIFCTKPVKRVLSVPKNVCKRCRRFSARPSGRGGRGGAPLHEQLLLIVLGNFKASRQLWTALLEHHSALVGVKQFHRSLPRKICIKLAFHRSGRSTFISFITKRCWVRSSVNGLRNGNLMRLMDVDVHESLGKEILKHEENV